MIHNHYNEPCKEFCTTLCQYFERIYRGGFSFDWCNHNGTARNIELMTKCPKKDKK